MARIWPMKVDRRPDRRTRRPPKPLDQARLEQLGLAYVARFATSAAKLKTYLARKLREFGWDGENAPDLAEVVARYVELGYVDDEAFARAKAGGLLRRGFGPRRVGQALNAAGIAGEIRETVRASEDEERHAALTLARKRGFGPFGAERPERAAREKQIGALLRAGHPLDSARELVNAASVEAAEEWAFACDGEE